MSMDALMDQFAPTCNKTIRVQGSRRPLNYYDNPRHELAAWVPTTAARVLDIGCGRGQLGRLLRLRGGHWVSGIELIPSIAEQAGRYLDEVVCGDVETVYLPWRANSFDAIVCGDVLEHLADPWHTLKRLMDLLAPGGLVVASLPNVQNFRVIKNLIRGQWEYQPRGLLDFGHLRFFTWPGIQAMFEDAGLSILRKKAIWNRTTFREMLHFVTGGRCEPYLARRYLVAGLKPELVTPPVPEHG